ncbi:MAG TPA: AAA family ATPase [Gemmatimonadaceae bacterium]|nr:AAA family ATPase [Gemmatimonadaceae bacterium]
MTAAAGALFRLRVLGAPELLDDLGSTPKALGRGKPLALLCYLAVRGEARRDEVVDLLWRDVDEEKARNAFRQALHRLRLALGDEIVPHDRDRLRLGESSRLVIDLVQFEAAVAMGRFGEAIDLYGADFLDGFDLREPAFDLWAERERTRLRGRFRQILHDGAMQAGEAGHWDEAVTRTRRLLSLTPFDADVARLAASTLASAGRRIEAVELLRDFIARTERELGESPSPDIQAFASRLARDTSARDEGAATRPAPAAIPFIGRQQELSQLITLWRGVAEDFGALALIEGDVGSGKSGLLRELLVNIRALGPALVLSGRERFAGAQVPFGAFAEALKPAVRAPGVAGASPHLLAEAARLLPELRDMIVLPDVAAVDDEAARLRFFEGVAALVDAAAYERKTILAIDDAHHLTPSSLDLLTYLVARLSGAPVMFVLTASSQNAPVAVLARLRALAGAEPAHGNGAGPQRAHLVLRPLTDDEVRVALTKPALSPAIPRSAISSIIRAGQGNPLRLVQAARAAATGESIATTPVPLRDILLERFALLPSAHRRLYLVLAILGRPADVAFLATASHVPEPGAAEALRLLEQLGWVEREGAGICVVSEAAATAVCDSAGAPTRAFLAGWIADALTTLAEADDFDLARMHAMAGRRESAFERAMRGGFRALAAGARPEAVQRFSLARTVSLSSAQQQEVEAALEISGASKRRLGAGTCTADLRSAAPSDSDSTENDAAALPWYQRVFPHWRVLLTAAVVTVAVATLAVATRAAARAGRPAALDTLVVVEPDAGARRTERLAIGSLADGFSVGERLDRRDVGPAWVDSVTRPWSNALPSPRGDRVALARRDSTDALVVVSADRHDTLHLRAPGTDPVPLGWSPDGSRLLVSAARRLSSGEFDSDLFVIGVSSAGTPVIIDTSADRGIAEAQWSPDGAHIAWVARTGLHKQLEVYVGLADGSEPWDVSASDADDYHIAWSPSGDLLAFTSTRDGNPELYVADLGEPRLWRLTTNVAHDDRATFAPSGRFIAFESTRDGFGAVYAIPPLGGQTRAVDQRRPLDIAGWRSATPRYVDRLRVDATSMAAPGSTARIALQAFDRKGDTMPVQHIEWRILDTAIVAFADSVSDGVAVARTLRGRLPGLARVVASVGRWRADTAIVRVGNEEVTLLDERFRPDWQRRWRALGDPEPAVQRVGASSVLLLRSPKSWDSGVLSLDALPLLPGLVLSADIAAPFSHPSDAGMVVTLALAAPENDADVDVATPQLLRLVSLSWNAESRRLIYSVGREAFSEPADSLLPADAASARIRVMEDSTVSFSIAGVQRWRSGLKLSPGQFGTRAQLWLSGRATGEEVRVARVSAVVEGVR